MIFLSPFLDVIGMFMSTVICTVRLWSSLPAKCILSMYDLNIVTSWAKKNFCLRVLTEQLCWMLFIFLFFYFLVISYLLVAVQPCMKWIPTEKKEKEKGRKLTNLVLTWIVKSCGPRGLRVVLGIRFLVQFSLGTWLA